MNGDIVRKDGIEELIGHRARALELYGLVEATLAEARAAHARACVGTASINPPSLDELRYGRDERYLKAARENIDRDMWRAFLNNTPLGSLMDVQERKAFDDALKNPPEVTAETVFATMDRLRADSGMIFRRGLVNAFANLSREYKSHDGFKVGPRMVLEWIVCAERYSSGWWVRLQYHAEERLRDLDRVFHILDGEPAPEYQQGLCAAMRTAMGANCQAWQVETPYFRVKWFKNGNAHLHFARDDLVQKANRLIAEHYGAVVGAASHVAGKRPSAAPPPEPCLTDFYETPADLAQRMAEAAGIEPYHTVLEPSAGEGAIIKALAPAPRFLTCYEAHPGRAATLRRTFPAATVWQDDFLRVTAKPIYDRVLMNPPFSGGADVLHVAHALNFLAPGGRLVAIMAAGIAFRQSFADTALRARLNELGAEMTALPVGTFKDSGTMVNTVMVVVDRPA